MDFYITNTLQRSALKKRKYYLFMIMLLCHLKTGKCHKPNPKGLRMETPKNLDFLILFSLFYPCINICVVYQDKHVKKIHFFCRMPYVTSLTQKGPDMEMLYHLDFLILFSLIHPLINKCLVYKDKFVKKNHFLPVYTS